MHTLAATSCSPLLLLLLPSMVKLLITHTCNRPCSPTLGGRPLTAGRLKAQSGAGTAASPYVLFVPVASANEWTVQAVTGSNANGASDADDSDTVVATGGLIWPWFAAEY